MKYPELVINKRATVNPKIRDNKLFQYSTIVALNHENIEIHLKRISNIESFIDQYNWEGTEFIFYIYIYIYIYKIKNTCRMGSDNLQVSIS